MNAPALFDDAPLTDQERHTVEANTGLVWFVIHGSARGYLHDLDYSEEDAYQDGIIGLAQAVRKWDPDRGALSTVATRWIHQAIQKGRGHASGLEYRAWRDGRAEQPTAPLRIDQPTSGDNHDLGTLADFLPAPDDTAAEAIDSLGIVAQVDAMRDLVCRDPFDHEVLDAIVSGRSPSMLAKARGRRPMTGLRRRDALLERIRAELGVREDAS